MNYKNLLSIGELANTCNVSHKTLRYYDNIGILKPAKINPENGYRYYAKWQITRIMTIKELQSLGFSLVEIKMCLESEDTEALLNNLKNIFISKKNDIKEQILILNKSLEKIKIFNSQYEKIEKILMLEKEQNVTVKNLISVELFIKNILVSMIQKFLDYTIKKFWKNSGKKDI